MNPCDEQPFIYIYIYIYIYMAFVSELLVMLQIDRDIDFKRFDNGYTFFLGT